MSDARGEYERRIEESRSAIGRGDPLGAEAALVAAIHIADTEGGNDAAHADALFRLGALQHDEGNAEEAERLLREALATVEHTWDTDDRLRIAILTALGQVLAERGKPDDARVVLAEALALRDTDADTTDIDLVFLLNELSRLCLKQGAYAEAEPLLQRLLAVKRVKGEEHPEVATVLASLAAVREGSGDLVHAEEMYRRALQIRQQTLAANHFSIAATLEQLARVCAARGVLGDAVSYYQQALGIRELTVGNNHASIRAARERIADLQLQAQFGAAPAMSVPHAPATQRPPVVLVPGAGELHALHREMDGAEDPSTSRRSAAFQPDSRGRQAAKTFAMVAGFAVLLASVFGLKAFLARKNTPPALVEAQAVGAPTSAIAPTIAPTVTPPVKAVPVSSPPSTPAPTRGVERASGNVALGDDKAPRGPTEPRLIGSGPTPRYPDELRSLNIQGSVLVQFTVDEKGRVDMSSMEVLDSPHALFTEAVRKVLPKYRFEPARTAPPESRPHADTVAYAFNFHAKRK
ncbi:MAG: TonB family protein [bacterium]